MTAGRRRWLLAGVAAIVALVCWGGVALAGSLLSSPTAPVFENSGSIGHASEVVRLAQVVDQTNSPAPADDQYGNPLEGKLCAVRAEIDLAPPRVGDSVESEVGIVNCGDVPVTISPLQQSTEDSPFHPVHEGVDSRPQCPTSAGDSLPTLEPGDFCVLFVIFPGIPSRPPGDYSDTWTFPGDNASVTVQLRGTVPPHTPGDEQYGNPLVGKLCTPTPEVSIDWVDPDSGQRYGGVEIDNCSDATLTLSPLQKSDEGSPFFPLRGGVPECPFGTDPPLTLAPRGYCFLFVGFPGSPAPPPGDYSDTWTFPADKASVSVHLTGTVPGESDTTFFVSAFNVPDSMSACATGPVNTGIVLSAGLEAVITASGSATWSLFGAPNGPDGDPAGLGSHVPGGPIAALIGRVHTSSGGTWMAIGSGPTTVTGADELQLAFDDPLQLCDNTGGFTVNVHLQAAP